MTPRTPTIMPAGPAPGARTSRPARRLRPVLLGACLLLGGCAAQQAWRQGHDLIAEGRPAEGLAQLAAASRIDPGSARYRIDYLSERDRYVGRLLDEAAAALAASDIDTAQARFRQVLDVHGADERALEGLRRVDRHRRWQAWQAQAQAAMERQDVDRARAALGAILSEHPRHEPARSMLERIEDHEADAHAGARLSQAYRKPVSIEFKDAPLKAVFEVLARTSGLNFVFDQDVRTDRRTSIFLRNATVEAALRLALLTNQLDQRVLDANSVLVYPDTPAKQKAYRPLSVKSFYLASADAKSVANSLKTLLGVRDVVIDEKLNLLIVRDTPQAIALAGKLVAVHDVAEPEVMLELEILEVKRARLTELGVRWPDQLAFTPLPSASGSPLTVQDVRQLDAAHVGVGVGPVTLHARTQDGRANLLANPRVRTRNREKAHILIGERVPNITSTLTSTGFASESVSYVDVGLKLDLEPTVYPDGDVAIRVAMEVSTILEQVQSKGGSTAYRIGTRNAQTVLRLRDGENQVLAGLISDEERRSGHKVPALGDIPLLGRLFGSQVADASKTEILLSITPRVVRNVVRPHAATMTFDAGTEGRIGGKLLGAAGAQRAAGEDETPGTPRTPRDAGAGDGQEGGDGEDAKSGSARGDAEDRAGTPSDNGAGGQRNADDGAGGGESSGDGEAGDHEGGLRGG